MHSGINIPTMPYYRSFITSSIELFPLFFVTNFLYRIQKQTDNSKALLDSKVARLEEEKRDLELCVANLERESKEMKSEITQLTTRLKSTQKEVDCYDDMQSKLHRTEMKLKETEHNYDALQSKLDNTVMELKGAERVLDDTKTRLVTVYIFS